MILPAPAPARITEFQRALDLSRIYVKGHLPKTTGSIRAGRIRIVSWNIERGMDPVAIADRLNALRPDIACLQEVDWGNRRTGGVDVLETLSRQTGMLGLYGIEFLELDSPERSTRFAGGGAIGNALLTRLPPAAYFRVELPIALDWSNPTDTQLPTALRKRMRREPRFGRRFGVGAEFALGPIRVVVCSLHLEDKFGGVRGRWSQYSTVADFIRSRREPTLSTATCAIIAGDFNTFDSAISRPFTHDSAGTAFGLPFLANEARWWKSHLLPTLGYADPFLSRTWTFRVLPVFWAKLDWITIDGAIVCDFGVEDAGPSDHRPLWVDLDLEDPPSSDA